MYISTGVIISAGFTAFICTLGLIIAFVVLIKKGKIAAPPFLWGVAIVAVVEILAIRILMSWVQLADWYGIALENTLFRLMIYSIPTAIFCEGLRLFVIKKPMKKYREKFHAVSLGMGSGFCGIMIFTGVFITGNFVLMIMMRTGSFYDTIYMNISDYEMSVIREQINSFSVSGILWLLPKSAARCILHIACSELMLICVRKSKYGFVLSAVSFHAVWEVLAHTGLRAWLESVLLLTLSFAALIYAVRYAKRRMVYGDS